MSETNPTTQTNVAKKPTFTFHKNADDETLVKGEGVTYTINRDAIVKRIVKDDGTSTVDWRLTWETSEPVLYVNGQMGVETWRHFPHPFARDLDLYKDNFTDPHTPKVIKAFWQKKRVLFGQTFYRHEAKRPNNYGWKFRHEALTKEDVVYVTFDNENITTRSRQKGNITVTVRDWDPKWNIQWTEDHAKARANKVWKGVADVWPAKFI